MLHAPLFIPTAKLDIPSLLKSSSPSPPPRTSHPPLARSVSVPTANIYNPLVSSPSTSTASQISTATAPPHPLAPAPRQQPLRLPRPSGPKLAVPALVSSSTSKRGPPTAPHPSASPAKKHNSKWSASEDELIISLRGDGMKWDDISERLPGRTAIACRLHYQNYLERRVPWDEEKKDKLARLYERIKPELWQPLAKELGVPWRSVEAMHWAMGEREMASRAGTIPFAMAASGYANPPSVSSSSSASGMERSGSGYAPAELTAGIYGGSDYMERASEERETKRSRRPPTEQLMRQQQAPQHLAPVGQRLESGHGVILPSLAELTASMPAYAPPSGERSFLEPECLGRRRLEADQSSLQDVKHERRESKGSEEQDVTEEERERPPPRRQ